MPRPAHATPPRRRGLALSAALIATAAALMAVGPDGTPRETVAVQQAAEHTHPRAVTNPDPTRSTKPARPRTPEPTTLAGYRRMFDRVPVTEWGGADISVSERLDDGRVVWLYGDTLSFDNGFVHSTAIVQDGGSLHVSRGGAQVLPDGPKVDGRERIYWVETFEGTGRNRLTVTAAPMSIGTASVWDFHRWRTESRTATLRVTRTGDVVFEGWTGWVPAPVLPDEFIVLGPNHFTYQPVIHEHIRLANGQYLKTVAQNWDDDLDDHVRGGKMRLKDWRPIFSQVPTARHPDAL